MPQGAVVGTMRVGGQERAVRGIGYHDHNWGDASMLDLIHDRYRGRATVGPSTVIASYITPLAEYGTEAIPLFMLARDGAVVADDASKITFTRRGVYTDGCTGKPVATETLQGGTVVESYTEQSSVWELMYFRHAPTAASK